MLPGMGFVVPICSEQTGLGRLFACRDEQQALDESMDPLSCEL